MMMVNDKTFAFIMNESQHCSGILSFSKRELEIMRDPQSSKSEGRLITY